MKFILYTVFISMLFSSCIVTKKKYDDILAQKVRLEGDLADRDALLTKANDDLQALDERVKELTADTTALGQDVRATAAKLSEMDKEYNQLSAYYKNLLTSSGKLNRDMAQQQEQLLAIQQNLDRTRRTNDSLSVSLDEREKKVRELENIMAAKDKAVQDLKSSISSALLSFKENDLTVNVKNGKVYVSLAEQLLFASGSTTVDSKGITALQQLAKALKDKRDIHIMVEGHTDNVPVSKKSQYMQDNWDLSVMRATAITKILTKAGVSPNQITAAGKGEHVPLVTNTTAQNKQKNRRTEIIITPNLDELFKILESN